VELNNINNRPVMCVSITKYTYMSDGDVFISMYIMYYRCIGLNVKQNDVAFRNPFDPLNVKRECTCHGVDDLCVFQKSLTGPPPEIRFQIGNLKPPTWGGLEGRIARAGDFNFHKHARTHKRTYTQTHSHARA